MVRQVVTPAVLAEAPGAAAAFADVIGHQIEEALRSFGAGQRGQAPLYQIEVTISPLREPDFLAGPRRELPG